MTDPEIVRGLRFLRDGMGWRCGDVNAVFDAAISRLSATCGTCQYFRAQSMADTCGHPKGMMYPVKSDYCNQHTPRTEEP